MKNGIALIWGFAEATLFFIVPDVWLSVVARNNLKKGLQASLFALFGALFGGCLMYLWGATNNTQAITILDYIPAISTQMIEGVHQALAQQGPFAIMVGPLQGVPYKLFAVQASIANISFVSFFLISIPARLIRFLIIASVSYAVSSLLIKYTSIKNSLTVVLTCWIIFYLFYFTLMAN